MGILICTVVLIGWTLYSDNYLHIEYSVYSVQAEIITKYWIKCSMTHTFISFSTFFLWSMFAFGDIFNFCCGLHILFEKVCKSSRHFFLFLLLRLCVQWVMSYRYENTHMYLWIIKTNSQFDGPFAMSDIMSFATLINAKV